MGKSNSKHLHRTSSLKDMEHDEQMLTTYMTGIFTNEVEATESMQTLLRGESEASKMMAQCFKLFGAKYLKQTLETHVKRATSAGLSYEIDPTRLEPSSDIKLNQKNLEKLTKEILDSILSSLANIPVPIRKMCICLRQVLSQKYPDSDMNVKAVGTVIFLRFINPALLTPVDSGLIDKQPPPKTMRGLMLVSKILQNIANNIEFSKEQHMLVFNDFVRTQFGPMRAWVTELSSKPSTKMDAASSSGKVVTHHTASNISK